MIFFIDINFQWQAGGWSGTPTDCVMSSTLEIFSQCNCAVIKNIFSGMDEVVPYAKKIIAWIEKFIEDKVQLP